MKRRDNICESKNTRLLHYTRDFIIDKVYIKLTWSSVLFATVGESVVESTTSEVVGIQVHFTSPDDDGLEVLASGEVGGDVVIKDGFNVGELDVTFVAEVEEAVGANVSVVLPTTSGMS